MVKTVARARWASATLTIVFICLFVRPANATSITLAESPDGLGRISSVFDARDCPACQMLERGDPRLDRSFGGVVGPRPIGGSANQPVATSEFARVFLTFPASTFASGFNGLAGRAFVIEAAGEPGSPPGRVSDTITVNMRLSPGGFPDSWLVRVEFNSGFGPCLCNETGPSLPTGFPAVGLVPETEDLLRISTVVSSGQSSFTIHDLPSNLEIFVRSPDVVPEPTTLLLFGTTMAGLGFAARRRRQRRK